MELERRLRKVSRYHLALFVLPLLSLLYYGWWNAATLDQRPDNPLRFSPMALRGDIRDRRGGPLAESVGEQRRYPLKQAAGPLLGYHLRGRNQSGLEALLQASLSPPPPPKSLWGALAMDRSRAQGHPPLKGPDVALTIDSAMQRDLYGILASQAGALVVAGLDGGEILAAVSVPAFDPNEIARDWQRLRSDPGSPLIERVGSGLYPVLTSAGEPLLDKEQTNRHPWFSENPFPGYPGASPAVIIDGQHLYTPLMLLQVASQGAQSSVLDPCLLAAERRTVAEPPLLPTFSGTRKEAGFELGALMGPEFRDSPPFQVRLGRRQQGLRPVAFALVLEGSSPEQAEAITRRILSALP